MRERPITAAIIGCGMIAGGYDEQGAGQGVRTHAGALAHRGILIGACVEPDQVRRKAFQERWGIKRAYSRIEDMLNDTQTIDLVCVCTPDERHAADLDALLVGAGAVVLAEKPLASDIIDARRLVGAYRQAGRSLAVNYTRRWNPVFHALARDIASGRYGKLAGVTGWYGKGILHNGSHMLDLLRMLVGELRPVSAHCLVDDGRISDPTLDALLMTTSGAPVQLIGTDHRQYDFFELQMRFEGAIVSLEEGGAALRIRLVEHDECFAGHARPVRGVWQDTATDGVMLRVIDNVVAHMHDGERLASDGASALAGQEIAATLIGMVRL